MKAFSFPLTAILLTTAIFAEPASAAPGTSKAPGKGARSRDASLDALLKLRLEDDRPAVKLFFEKHPEMMKNARAVCEYGLSLANTYSTYEAVALTNIAQTLAPGDTYVLASHAYTLTRNKSFRQAIRVAADALSRKKDARNYAIMAEVQQSRGSADQADLALKEAENLDPECFELTAARARIALSRLKGSEAIKYLDAYLNRHPRDMRTLVLKAETLDRLGNLEQSIEALDRLLKLKPIHALALQKRADVLQRQGKFLEAAGDIRKLLALTLDDSTRVIANVTLAECLEKAGDLEGAVQARAEIMRFLSPENNDELSKGIFKNISTNFAKETVALCRLENKNKQHDRALKKLNVVIKKFPTSTEALEQRAIAFEALGQWQNALKDWTKLIELHSEFPSWYKHRATAYEKLGDTIKAKHDRDKAKQLEKEL